MSEVRIPLIRFGIINKRSGNIKRGKKCMDFSDESMSNWTSGASVLDLIFPQPETVSEIRFRNWYTARFSLLVSIFAILDISLNCVKIMLLYFESLVYEFAPVKSCEYCPNVIKTFILNETE